MRKEIRETIGIIGQWVSAIVAGAGIGVELAMGAEPGFILITIGAVLFAIFTKVRR